MGSHENHRTRGQVRSPHDLTAAAPRDPRCLRLSTFASARWNRPRFPGDRFSYPRLFEQAFILPLLRMLQLSGGERQLIFVLASAYPMTRRTNGIQLTGLRITLFVFRNTLPITGNRPQVNEWLAQLHTAGLTLVVPLRSYRILGKILPIVVDGVIRRYRRQQGRSSYDPEFLGRPVVMDCCAIGGIILHCFLICLHQP